MISRAISPMDVRRFGIVRQKSQSVPNLDMEGPASSKSPDDGPECWLLSTSIRQSVVLNRWNNICWRLPNLILSRF